MQFKHLLGLAVLATVATLTHSAPTEVAEPPKESTVDAKEVTAEKEATVGVTADVKAENSADVKKEGDVPVVEISEVKSADSSKMTDNTSTKEATIGSVEAVSGDTKSDPLNLKEIIETVKEKEENLIELEKKLRDVATSVSESTDTTSKPGDTSPTKNKISEIISQFINELAQIPMVLIHAFSSAISTFTGNRINLPLNKSPPK